MTVMHVSTCTQNVRPFPLLGILSGYFRLLHYKYTDRISWGRAVMLWTVHLVRSPCSYHLSQYIKLVQWCITACGFVEAVFMVRI